MPGTLTPGSSPNWTATATPAQRGTASVLGYGLTPAAQWSPHTVQFSRHNGVQIMGVNAFHLCARFTGDEGIEKVEFICDNGAITTVTAPAPRPDTGLYEWWVSRVASATDKLNETRAIIYPWHGIPIVLQGEYKTTMGVSSFLPVETSSMLSWSNTNGTYNPVDVWVSAATGNDSTGNGTIGNPWASLNKSVTDTRFLGPGGDGSWVRHNMLAGVYAFPNFSWEPIIAQKGWQTFTPAAGVNPADVTIAGKYDTGSVRVRLAHFLNLGIRKLLADDFAFIPPASTQMPYFWYEGVWHTGHNKWLEGDPNQGCKIYYNISSALRRGRSTLAKGACRGFMLEGVDFVQSSGDGLGDGRTLRNCTMELIAYPGGLGLRGTIGSVADEPDHLDDWQSGGSNANVIFGDNRFIGGSKSQGLFWDRAKNHLINFNTIHGCATDPGFSAVSGGHGCMMLNCSFPNHAVLVCTSNVELDEGRMSNADFLAVGNIVVNLGYSTAGAAESQASYLTNIAATGKVQFANNHYVNATPLDGANATNGAVTWDANFFPTITRSVPRTVRWDIFQNARLAITRHGAMEYSSYVGITAASTLQKAGGIYQPPLSVGVTLASGTTGYFSTDGVAPTNASTPVTGGVIPITTSCTLMVIAYNEVAVASAVTSAAYQVITDGTPAPPRRIS